MAQYNIVAQVFGVVTLVGTLIFSWFFHGNSGSMLFVGALACVGFTLSWHLLVWGARVHDIYVKALDYPYYAMTALGFFAAFSLAQEQHAHSKASLRAQELAHVLIDVAMHCETPPEPSSDGCKRFTAVVKQHELKNSQFSLEALQTSGLFENSALLQMMPEIAALAPEFIDLTTHAVQVAHEEAHQAAKLKVQFETFWPFLLAFAFSIKLVKTSLELRRFRERYKAGSSL